VKSVHAKGRKEKCTQRSQSFFFCYLCASAVKNKKRDAPQYVPTILQSYYPTILFNDFHLRHLITLTNLVDDIQPFYHAAEAGVVAVEVCGVGARVANEKL